MTQLTRPQRYWRAQRLPLILSAVFLAIAVPLDGWTNIPPIALVVALSWMDTP